MHIEDTNYQKHLVFKDIDYYIAFYKKLSFAVMSWITVGTTALLNIDAYVYSSIQGTLSSIKNILHDGRITDAYTLLRKYHDSIVINIYTNVFLEEKVSLENLIVKQIDDWLKGTAPLPEYRTMFQFIQKSRTMGKITQSLFGDGRYKAIRNRCNDATHYNFYKFILMNDNEIYLKSRLSILGEFQEDLQNLIILHFALLFFIRENYMMASDHRDALDLGTTPEPESEYWVAPFIQDFFDEVVAKNRPDLAQIIKENTEMKLA